MNTKPLDSMIRLAWFSDAKYPIMDAIDAHNRLCVLPCHVISYWEKPSKF